MQKNYSKLRIYCQVIVVKYICRYNAIQAILINGLINREYSYYPNGQIKAITGVASYDYDPLNSLTKADSDSYDV